jgi:hypothetical protein
MQSHKQIPYQPTRSLLASQAQNIDAYERFFSSLERGISAAFLAAPSSKSCSRSFSGNDLQFGIVVAPSAIRFGETC